MLSLNYTLLVFLSLAISTNAFWFFGDKETTTVLPIFGTNRFTDPTLSGSWTGQEQKLENVAKDLSRTIEFLQRRLSGPLSLMAEQAIRNQIAVLQQNLNTINILISAHDSSTVTLPTVTESTGLPTVFTFGSSTVTPFVAMNLRV